MKSLIVALLLASGLCSCTIISANRDPGQALVFPKLDWYWSRDAKQQRHERREHAKEHALTQASVLPDSQLTPGIADANVTAQMLRSPKFIKARRNVSESEKRLVFQRYGIPWEQHKTYELDHYLPLCLGGQNCVSNLWPEPWTGPYGAHAKDRLEVYLHRRVNKGQMTLQEAQACFLNAPWTNAYNAAGFKPGLKQRVFSITHRPVK